MKTFTDFEYNLWVGQISEEFSNLYIQHEYRLIPVIVEGIFRIPLANHANYQKFHHKEFQELVNYWKGENKQETRPDGLFHSDASLKATVLEVKSWEKYSVSKEEGHLKGVLWDQPHILGSQIKWKENKEEKTAKIGKFIYVMSPVKRLDRKFAKMIHQQLAHAHQAFKLLSLAELVADCRQQQPQWYQDWKVDFPLVFLESTETKVIRSVFIPSLTKQQVEVSA